VTLKLGGEFKSNFVCTPEVVDEIKSRVKESNGTHFPRAVANSFASAGKFSSSYSKSP
jgi:hypothetical protein